MLKKVRYINNENNAHLAEHIFDPTVYKRGEIISPFSTKYGRVVWEIYYIEDVDFDSTLVYVKFLGYNSQ
jgi:hypothetical protein